MVFPFKGGVHPPENKSRTKDKRIEVFPAGKRVYIPFVQHTGAPATPLVKPGERVRKWQKIGEASGFISACVHSPVSGVVASIEEYFHPLGKKVLTCIIDVDEAQDSECRLEPLTELNPQSIRERVKEAGIVGLGGAVFPTVVKLSPPEEKKIDTVILNGAECEPFLTSDHALMREYPNEIISGLRLIMLVLGAKRGYIAIEKNKPDAIEIMRKSAGNEFEVVPLKVKYPQGAEKQLIKAITGREVPVGGLPFDVGVYVQNVGTAKAIYDAVYNGKPLVERVVTVTGGPVKYPQNILVPLGVTFQEILDASGVVWENVGKIVMGGPMMGITQFTPLVPVIKSTSGIVVFDVNDAKLPPEEPCIRCGRCVDACPMGLMPTTIATFASVERFDDAEQYGALACIECGCCSYICPSKRRLVHYIKLAKSVLLAKRKK